jgi:hypothetical protein
MQQMIISSKVSFMVKILHFIFISSNLIYHVIILDIEFQVLISKYLFFDWDDMHDEKLFFWHEVFYNKVICCFFSSSFEGGAL